ncbi:MAG: hypothetical protein OK456_01310 [Thaumarchaeota archaeon]|nr:hypothetical protein [Nitrososphaerota archaeon]
MRGADLSSLSRFADAIAYYAYGLPVSEDQTVVVPRRARTVALLSFFLVNAIAPGTLLLLFLGGTLGIAWTCVDTAAYAFVRLTVFKFRLTINPPPGPQLGRWLGIAAAAVMLSCGIAILWPTADGLYFGLAAGIVVAYLGFRMTRVGTAV